MIGKVQSSFLITSIHPGLFFLGGARKIAKSDYWLSVQTGVRQGCILSPTRFLIVIDVVTRNVNRERRRGIQWGLVNRLEDLDFADDLCLLSESHGDMQTKLEDLTNKAEKQDSEST